MSDWMRYLETPIYQVTMNGAVIAQDANLEAAATIALAQTRLTGIVCDVDVV